MNKVLKPAQDSVLSAIGNTPVVKLRKVVPPASADVYVKLEYFNPTCGYKDRVVQRSGRVRGNERWLNIPVAAENEVV